MIISVTDITPLTDSYNTNKALFNKGYSMVEISRQKKIDSTSITENKSRSLAAGLLLNYSLYEYTHQNNYLSDNKNEDFSFREVSIEDIIKPQYSEISYTTACGEHGKPFFENSNLQNLHFSLSHAGKYAMCVISDRLCGGDIERKHSFNSSMPKRHFSALENEWLSASENPQVLTDRFFRLWVLKESYSKYTGEGIGRELRNAHFVYDSNCDKLLFENNDNTSPIICFEKDYGDYRIGIVADKDN